MSKPQRQIASIWITVEKRGGGAARRDDPKKHHHRFPHYKRDGQPIRIRYYYVFHIREGKKNLRGFLKYIFLFFVPRCYATIQSSSFTLCLNPQYLVLPHAEHSFKGEKNKNNNNNSVFSTNICIYVRRIRGSSLDKTM